MKRIILLLILFVALVGTANAKSCVTTKLFIAIDNSGDYMNMVFTSAGGEEALQAYARVLIKKGTGMILGNGERLDVVGEHEGCAIFKRDGKTWLIPASVLRCK